MGRAVANKERHAAAGKRSCGSTSDGLVVVRREAWYSSNPRGVVRKRASAMACLWCGDRLLFGLGRTAAAGKRSVDRAEGKLGERSCATYDKNCQRGEVGRRTTYQKFDPLTCFLGVEIST